MFSERLRWLRKCKEITQIKMSEFLNLAPTSYHGYESGKNKPPMDTIIKLADYFDVSVDYLLCLTDIPTKNYVKLSPVQMKLIHDFKNLNNEQLEILEIYNSLNDNLKAHINAIILQLK